MLTTGISQGTGQQSPLKRKKIDQSQNFLSNRQRIIWERKLNQFKSISIIQQK